MCIFHHLLIICASRLKRGSSGSALACCMAGPSFNPGSAPQGGFSIVAKKRWEKRERPRRMDINECTVWNHEKENISGSMWGWFPGLRAESSSECPVPSAAGWSSECPSSSSGGQQQVLAAVPADASDLDPRFAALFPEYGTVPRRMPVTGTCPLTKARFFLWRVKINSPVPVSI